MPGEFRLDRSAEMAAQPGDAAKQAHRADVEIGSFAVPLGKNFIDVIHTATMANIILTSR
jgi:hypothetical protein